MTEEGRFKHVFDFGEGKLMAAIHHSFRVQFMKDVVLPRYLNEEAYASIVFMVRCSFAEIVEGLEADALFLPQLMAALSPSPMKGRVVSLLKLIKEYLALAKTSATGRQLAIYQPDAFASLVTFLRDILRLDSDPDSRDTTDDSNDETNGDALEEAQFLASEIILSIIQYDTNLIRTHTLSLSKASPPLPLTDHLLCAIIDKCNDLRCPLALRWQLVAILRNLLDNSAPLGAVLAISNDDFLNFFYPDFALRLLSPLIDLDLSAIDQDRDGNKMDVGGISSALKVSTHPTTTRKNCLSVVKQGMQKVKLARAHGDLLYNTCELLITFIIQHKYRIKYLLFKSFIIHNALSLLHCLDRSLRLCALRTIRTMLSTQDDFYFRFLIKQSLFKTILDEAISLPPSTDNALTSAIIDLFLVLRDRKFKIVLNHLIECHRRDLERISFYPIGKMLMAAVAESTSYRLDANRLDDDREEGVGGASEEAYFSNLDDDGEEVEGEEDTKQEEDDKGDSEDEFVSSKTDADEYDTRPTPTMPTTIEAIQTAEEDDVSKRFNI